MKAEKIPYDGCLVVPKTQDGALQLKKQTVVFIHQWGGNRNSVKSHMNFVAELGYKSVSFNQSFHSRKTLRFEQIQPTQLFKGLRQIWTKEISDVLDSIAGEKIVYSFSLPSGAALKALGDRKANDVKAWICDGGPFLNLQKCYWNYFTHQRPFKNILVREAAVLGGFFLFGGWSLKQDLSEAFENLPDAFPVLSIRGWQDPLVPLSAIDEVFKLAKNIQLEVLALPEGKHINGLKSSPKEYRSRVARFLDRVIT